MSPSRRVAPSTPLLLFCEKLFVPLHLAQRPDQALHYAAAVGWLARTLKRPALIGDISAANIRQTMALLADVGIGYDRAKGIRTQLSNLWKFAHELGIAPEVETVALKRREFADGQQHQSGSPSPLRDFYISRMRPDLVDARSGGHVAAHDRAVVHFENFVRDHWQGPIGPAAVDAFCHRLAGDGKRAATVAQFRNCLERVLRRYAPEIATVKPRPAPRNASFRAELFGPPIELPPAPAGTLRHLFEREYLPQRLVDAIPRTVGGYRRMLECLRVFAGRDVLVAEMTDELLLGYLARLREANVAPRTLNGERARLLSLWRFAYESRQLEQLPRVRKAKEYRDAPEAWNEDELRRLLAACDVVRGRPIGGFAFADYWQAMLLVAYWTAVRRRGIFGIARDDVSCQHGTIRVRGRAMKNRAGQAFHIGPDCVAAITKIWLPARELLFPWPYDPSTIDRHFRKLKAAAGLRSDGRHLQSFHRVRRSSATITASRGGIQAAMALLGHSDARLTQDCYIDRTKLAQTNCDFLTALIATEDSGGPARRKGGA